MIKKLISIVCLILLWQLLTETKWINPMFLAAPIDVIHKGYQLIRESDLFLDILHTLKRIFIGVLSAILLGVPFGLLIGFRKSAYTYFEGVLDFLRSIPPILVFPLALLTFGRGDASRIGVVFFGCSAILTFHTAQAASHVSEVRINSARILGAKGYQILYRIIFFDSLIDIMVGIRVALSMGIIISIVTEMLIGTKYGLGSRVLDAQISYDTPAIYFLVILVGILGMMINKSLQYIESKLIHWKDKI